MTEIWKELAIVDNSLHLSQFDIDAFECAQQEIELLWEQPVEMIKEMPRLDWTERESVRASLRRSVRRLLARYGYPPDLAEDATQLVLRQAELSTENVV